LLLLIFDEFSPAFFHLHHDRKSTGIIAALTIYWLHGSLQSTRDNCFVEKEMQYRQKYRNNNNDNDSNNGCDMHHMPSERLCKYCLLLTMLSREADSTDLVLMYWMISPCTCTCVIVAIAFIVVDCSVDNFFRNTNKWYPLV
jgi:hypothetical protein